MSARAIIAPLALVLVTAGVGLPRQTPAETPVTAAGQPQNATVDDQTDLAVTVYNSDLALVRDVRELQIARGTSDLHFMDIAATVNPATVHFRSLTEPSRVNVLEQNYEYDLLEPDKLLRKYVGTRRHARANGAGPGPHARRGRSRRACSATTTRPSGKSAARSSPGCAPITSASPSCRATSTRGRRSSGRSTTRAPSAIASRRRTWRRSCRGTPTTC